MRIIVLAAAAVLASPAAAVVGVAPQAATAAVDPAALTAATALVQQLDVRADVIKGLEQQIAMTRSGVPLRNQLATQPGFVQAYRANPSRFDAALQKAGAIQADIMAKVLRDNSAAIAPTAAAVYARGFSAAELKQLADFYRTPLGRALYARGPRVNAEILGRTGSAMGPKIAAAMQAAAPRIEAALAPLQAKPVPAAKR